MGGFYRALLLLQCRQPLPQLIPLLPADQAIYALRKTIVEPVFGQIKTARGLDRFLLRGLEKVNEE